MCARRRTVVFDGRSESDGLDICESLAEDSN